MNINDKIRYIGEAIKETKYINRRQQKSILKKMEEEDLISEDNEEDDVTNCLFYELNNNGYKTVEKIEEFEFQMPYKYSFIYKINNCELLMKKLKEENIFEESEVYKEYISNPIIKNHDGAYQIKFSYIIQIRDDDAGTIKYPILVDIFPEYKMIQIKMNATKNTYKKYKGNEFYTFINDNVHKWLSRNLLVRLEIIDFFTVFHNILNEENPAITQFKFGAFDSKNGKMKITIDDEDSLPIIGALISVKEEFESEFDKELLDDLIEDLESKSKYFERGIKFLEGYGDKKQIVVTKRRDSEFLEDKICILHFYGNNQDKERMDYIVKYFSEYI